MLCGRRAANSPGASGGYLEEIRKGATKICETSKHLTDRDCIAIASTLKAIANQVDFLDLFDNNIGPSGASKLAQALESEVCQLKSLKLAYNHIGDAGAIRLAQALRHSNCKLEKLDLSGCSIETSGAQAIVDSVKCSLTIKTVYLFGNQHDLEEELKQALAGPRKPSTTSRRISGLVFRAS